MVQEIHACPTTRRKGRVPAWQRSEKESERVERSRHAKLTSVEKLVEVPVPIHFPPPPQTLLHSLYT